MIHEYGKEVRMGSTNQLVNAYAKNLGKRFQFYVRHKSLAAFDSLNGILINVNTDQLHFIRKCSLRELGWMV